MEDQCSPPSWGCFYLEEGIEELKHSLLYTTLELETTILSAHEEIARKEEELIHHRELLAMTIKERNEFQRKCQMMELEKAILQQGKSDTARNEDELKGGGISNKGPSSSDSTQNNSIPPPPPPPQPPPLPPQLAGKLVSEKPLPENGNFLKAVMDAGPLLQTLLLAGQLPQWQHPPPQLNSMEIPPVTISSPPQTRILHQDSGISTNSSFNSKRRVMVPCEASDSSSQKTKYQKVVHQSPLTN